MSRTLEEILAYSRETGTDWALCAVDVALLRQEIERLRDAEKEGFVLVAMTVELAKTELWQRIVAVMRERDELKREVERLNTALPFRCICTTLGYAKTGGEAVDGLKPCGLHALWRDRQLAVAEAERDALRAENERLEQVIANTALEMQRLRDIDAQGLRDWTALRAELAEAKELVVAATGAIASWDRMYARFLNSRQGLEPHFNVEAIREALAPLRARESGRPGTEAQFAAERERGAKADALLLEKLHEQVARATTAERNYIALCDAVCRESTGVDDACRQARSTRAERDNLRYLMNECLTEAKQLGLVPGLESLREWIGGYVVTLKDRAAAAEAEVARLNALVDSADSFCIYMQSHQSNPIRVERTVRNTDTWAIRFFGECVNRDGKWEYEPMPSSRDDAFIARTRFPLVEALERARAIAAKESSR